MNKRQIGNSQLFTAEIGLGCMSLQPSNPNFTFLIHKALDYGINFFDTADLYDFGANESMLGRALKKHRENVIIATKVGNEWNESKNNWTWNPTKKYILEAVKESLKRLETDYIDLYQLHGGTIDDPIDETIEAFEQLVKEGYIRYYGISSIRPNVIKEYVKKSNIISVMMQYSLLDRRPEELFPLLAENNVSVIVRGPVAKGLLTDSFVEKLTTDYLSYSKQELSNTLPILLQWAKHHQLKLHETALKFVLSQERVAVTIPGASNLDQLLANISASSKSISVSAIKDLRKLLKISHYTEHI